jgi:transaldolase/glucose-6-phosphate isomerase
MNPLLAVRDLGQSIWYDNIRRGLLTSGELARLVAEDGVAGVTTNPAILEKAITGSTDYAEQLDELRGGPERDAQDLFEALAIRDVQGAADVLRGVYEAADRGDGYVSLEVSPSLAHDTAGTVAEAERLWAAVGRENLMVKVPATAEGIPAVRLLIGRGINVNVTLLFAVEVYERVAEAYVAGLEDLVTAGGDPSAVASVASFFVSRIDVAVDAELAGRGERGRALLGRAAVANANRAYDRYLRRYDGERWAALADRGARPQRLLWASTSTKNPAYRDVRYVEELIGPDTVDTVPPVTLDAFRDHGEARVTLGGDTARAEETLAALDDVGVSLEAITDRLLDEGVAAFTASFDRLLAAVAETCRAAPGTRPDSHELALPADLRAAVDEVVADWQAGGKVRRLWARDASLWTGGDEARWLGWLGVAEDQLAHSGQLDRIAADAREAGFADALLLGMGGSSLFPELLALTFPPADGHPRLRVLDSTDPAQVRAADQAVDPARTLFLVSSKSGSTLEPNIFLRHFLERAGGDRGRFVAITDPGSSLDDLATTEGFRHVAHGLPSIGGRYSALSNFGMVPGAVSGVDVHRLLGRAQAMAQACASCVPGADNPGLVLGAVLGACAARGRDKVTLAASPGVHDLGAWLEQLLAESTGKQGNGIIPVDREPLGPPAVYGDDRLFVYARLDSAPDEGQDAAVAALEAAGQPVVRLHLADAFDLGAEVFRWEFATAVAGAVLGINPFDQPDVEASKDATRALTDAYERTGALPEEHPFAVHEGLGLYADEANAAALAGYTLADVLRAHLRRVVRGDYVALLAYIPMTDGHERTLTALRRTVRDRLRVATVVGFGPRFLHSTGQAYKGGPDSGVFLQVTCDDAEDLPVPGRALTFGVVKAAQARGDLAVLNERGRRALRLHLGADVEAGLEALDRAVERALR